MRSVRSTVERRFESYSGSLFSAMKTEYVVAPPLGPAYSIIPFFFQVSVCSKHLNKLDRHKYTQAAMADMLPTPAKRHKRARTPCDVIGKNWCASLCTWVCAVLCVF